MSKAEGLNQPTPKQPEMTPRPGGPGAPQGGEFCEDESAGPVHVGAEVGQTPMYHPEDDPWLDHPVSESILSPLDHPRSAILPIKVKSFPAENPAPEVDAKPPEDPSTPS